MLNNIEYVPNWHSTKMCKLVKPERYALNSSCGWVVVQDIFSGCCYWLDKQFIKEIIAQNEFIILGLPLSTFGKEVVDTLAKVL